MKKQRPYRIYLTNPDICVEGMSEDGLREFAEALAIDFGDNPLDGLVTASRSSRVKFNIDSSGNFTGVTAVINGKPVNLINGVGSQELGIFIGPPTTTNPGPGWAVDVERTRRFLAQPEDENQWDTFYAVRVGILNSFVVS